MANHISDPSAPGRFRWLPDTAEQWSNLSLYGRFEQAVALVLTLLVSGMILLALADLIAAIVGSLLVPGLPVLDHAVFQGVFGMIMTVLIALEFNHTILSILHRKKSIVQLRTVISDRHAGSRQEIHHRRFIGRDADNDRGAWLCRVVPWLRLLVDPSAGSVRRRELIMALARERDARAHKDRS